MTQPRIDKGMNIHNITTAEIGVDLPEVLLEPVGSVFTEYVGMDGNVKSIDGMEPCVVAAAGMVVVVRVVIVSFVLFGERCEEEEESSC